MTETQKERQSNSFRRKLGNAIYTVRVHFGKGTARSLRIECKG